MRPAVAFLVFLPVLSVLGTQIMNYYHINIILELVILSIAFVPLFVIRGTLREKDLPVAIVAVALALLYQTALRFTYLWGADIHQEYYFANMVLRNSFWDMTLPIDYNSVLSVVILAPVTSIVSGIDLMWVLKAMYPTLFSIVPLVLYLTYRTLVDYKTAFMGSFFFMSIFTFYGEMLGTTKEQIAELLFVIMIFLIIERKLPVRRKAAILVLLAIALTFSHYALAYIFLWCLILLALGRRMFPALGRLMSVALGRRMSAAEEGTTTITGYFVVLFAAIFSAWYLFVASSEGLHLVTGTTYSILWNIPNGLFNPDTAQGLNIVLVQSLPSVLHQTTKGLNLLMIVFITVGVLGFVVGRRKPRLGQDFAYLSVIMYALNIGALALPYLAASLNTTRIYHLTLIFLAPLGMMGAYVTVRSLWGTIVHLTHKGRSLSDGETKMIVAMVLALLLVFNTGLVYEVTRVHPDSPSLSQDWIEKHGNSQEKINFYGGYTPEVDIASAGWVAIYRSHLLKVYSDFRARNNVLNSHAMISRAVGQVLDGGEQVIDGDSYIYLRKLNVVDGLMGGGWALAGLPPFFETSTYGDLLSQSNLIYSNGSSQTYYTITVTHYSNG